MDKEEIEILSNLNQETNGDHTQAKVETEIDASSAASSFEMAAMGAEGMATESIEVSVDDG